MFRRETYRALAPVLEAFDPAALERTDFRFAGGTRIALELDEFRESRDIDFICADAAGYRDLRNEVRSNGYHALFSAAALASIELPREPRVDQYGIRFPAVVSGRTVRVELIREARFTFGAPMRPAWTSLPCLAIDDCFTEKLLANSDRWADRDVLARDLIDLGMLRTAYGSVPVEAWRAAEGAYGMAARGDLIKALVAFQDDEAFRRRCFSGLGVSDEARVMNGIAALAADVGIAHSSPSC